MRVKYCYEMKVRRLLCNEGKEIWIFFYVMKVKKLLCKVRILLCNGGKQIVI